RHILAIGVTTDDGREYFFAASQFLDAELAAHSHNGEKGDAPERLRVRYVSGEILILGRGLRRLAEMLQRGELENMRPIDQRYTGLRHGLLITSITITRK